VFVVVFDKSKVWAFFPIFEWMQQNISKLKLLLILEGCFFVVQIKVKIK
jgi:hypothetical protein